MFNYSPAHVVLLGKHTPWPVIDGMLGHLSIKAGEAGAQVLMLHLCFHQNAKCILNKNPYFVSPWQPQPQMHPGTSRCTCFVLVHRGCFKPQSSNNTCVHLLSVSLCSASPTTSSTSQVCVHHLSLN